MPLSPPDSVIGSTYSAVSMVYTLQSGLLSSTPVSSICENSVSKLAEASSPVSAAS